MNIRLRQLRAFKAIVEHGTVSDAAVALGLTQSTVSKTLAGFERELGFLLFDRHGRRLSLSEQGRIFLRQTGDVIELLQGINTAATDIRDNKAARFRVTAIGPLSMSSFLPIVLARHALEYPSFRYAVVTKTRAEIDDWIAGQHSDVGLTLLPVQRRQLSARAFARVRAVAIVPVGHELARRRHLAPSDMQNHDLIMPRSSVRLRNLVEASFIQAGVELRLRFETSNAVSTANLVAEGNGVAIVDPFTLTGIPGRKIRALRWEPATVLNYGLIWLGNRPLGIHERRLLELAAEVSQEMATQHASFALA